MTRKNATTIPSAMTLAQATQLRVACELEVLTLLRALCSSTGLDMRAVQVMTVAQPAKGDAVQVVPFAVRIDLMV